MEPGVEVMIALLAALTIGIVSTWRANEAGIATLKASEAEVMVVDLIAAVIKRTRRVTKLQQALVIARTTTD